METKAHHSFLLLLLRLPIGRPFDVLSSSFRPTKVHFAMMITELSSVGLCGIGRPESRLPSSPPDRGSRRSIVGQVVSQREQKNDHHNCTFRLAEETGTDVQPAPGRTTSPQNYFGQLSSARRKFSSGRVADYLISCRIYDRLRRSFVAEGVDGGSN